jgi:hypothetical protein
VRVDIGGEIIAVNGFKDGIASCLNLGYLGRAVIGSRINRLSDLDERCVFISERPIDGIHLRTPRSIESMDIFSRLFRGRFAFKLRMRASALQVGEVRVIVLWYGGPIALCAVVGALIGPRLLGW